MQAMKQSAFQRLDQLNQHPSYQVEPDSYGPRSYKIGLAIRSKGTGPQLVLIHGGSGSRTHWARNLDSLSRKFKVITPDLPGFGESANPPDEISTEEYLGWVAHAVRLAVSDEPFHLVGFSFGGVISAGVAAILSTHAHAPVGLTLVSPAGFGKPEGRAIRLERVKGIHEDNISAIRAVTARNLGRWMLAKEPSPSDASVDIHLQNVRHTRFDSRKISHGNLLVDHVLRASVPTQILLGEDDPLIFPSLRERIMLMTVSIPSARIEVIPGAGHWLPYEASDVVNLKICQFHLQGQNQ